MVHQRLHHPLSLLHRGLEMLLELILEPRPLRIPEESRIYRYPDLEQRTNSLLGIFQRRVVSMLDKDQDTQVTNNYSLQHICCASATAEAIVRGIGVYRSYEAVANQPSSML